jgi:diguanylate cyclase (GGDEF)-like protein
MYISLDKSRQVLDELSEDLSRCTPAYQSYGKCLHAMLDYDYDSAITFAYQALQQGHRTESTYIIIQAHIALGFIFDNQKIYNFAFEHYSAALKYTNSPRVLNNLGNLYMLLNQSDTAFEYFLRAKTVIEEAHPRVASIIYANIAECDCIAGRIDKAEKHLKISEEYNSLYRDTTPAFIYNIQALIEMKKEHYQKALNILELAESKIEQEGMLRYFLDILRWTAQCHILLNNPEAAVEKYLKIEELRIKYSYGLRVLSDIEALIDLYTVLGRKADILKLYKEYRTSVQEHEQERKQQKLENIQAQIRMQESHKREERYAQLYNSTKIISEIGREILSTDTSGEVLIEVRKRLSELFNVDRIVIGIFDEYTGQIDYQWECSGALPVAPVSIPLTQGNLEYQVIRQCVPVAAILDEKLLKIYREVEYQGIYEDTISLIMCPLHINNTVLGMISIHTFSTQTFTKYEIEMITTIASFIAATMQNWKKSNKLLMENRELDRKTKTDTLTGIGNRFAMEQRFNEIVDNHNTSVTMVMIDVDNFKLYNDRFGHDQGDACLKYVANVLFQYLNYQGNRLFRYGGDEFMAVLVGLDISDIGNLLDEVCRTVNLKSREELRDTSVVTCSIGWHFSENISGRDAMLQALRQADAALYMAKAKGRNRSTSSTELVSDKL